MLIILKLCRVPGISEDILSSLALILSHLFSASSRDSDLDVLFANSALCTDIFTLNHLCMRDCNSLKFLPGASFLTELVFRLILYSVLCVVFLRTAAFMGCPGGCRLSMELSCHAQAW